jgi:hypothetical protein
MVLYLAYLGIRLIRKDARALLQLCLLFTAEILYICVLVDVTWIRMPISMSNIAVGFWGMADAPLVPQLLTGYPLIGAVITLIMLIVRRKSPKML